MRITKITAIAAALTIAFAVPSAAQPAGRAIVSLYHAAPGHQIELLKWMAGQEKVAAAAGVPASQLYIHTDGDSWDYMLVQPITTPEQDAALEAAGKKLGIDASLRSSIELRKHIANHTDTFVRGPTSASAYLEILGEK